MPSVKRSSSELNKSKQKQRKTNETDTYPDIYTGKSLFLKMVKQCGVILMNGNSANVIKQDQSVFLKEFIKTIKRHDDYPEVIEDIMDGVVKYIDDKQRFIRMMLTTSFVEVEESLVQRALQDSVMRLLLKTHPLHEKIAELLVDKLNEHKENSSLQLEGEEHETINVPQLILNQLRWLDAIDNADLIASKLLSTASIMSHQSACAIVTSIPEIVNDEVHDKIALGLKELLSTNVELTIAILDTLCCLNCSESTMTNVKQAIFSCLRSVKIEELPVVVKYLLQTMNSDNAEESITCLREYLTFSPTNLSQNSQSSKRGSEETSVRLTAEAILYAAQYQPFVADSWIKILKKLKETEFTSSDLVSLVLLCTNYNAAMKKSAIALMKSSLQSGVIGDELIGLTFEECSHVLIPYFGTLSDLATQFVASSISALQHAGSVFYTRMFAHLDNYCRQEVIGCIVQHVGSFSASEADVALTILRSLAVDNLNLLAPSTLFIRGILDHVDQLSCYQIRLVYEVLSRLAFNQSEARIHVIEDELHMLIRKQLTHTSATFRCIGVIGAVNMLMILSMEENCDEKGYKTAISILNLLEETTISDNKTRAYYVDELSFMFQNEIDSRIAKRLHKTFKKEMKTKFIVEKDLNTSTQEDNLQSLFTLAANEADAMKIPIYPASRATDSRISLLCPLFRGLTETDTALSIPDLALCPILLHSAHNLIEFKSLGHNEQKTVLDSIFVSLNWFREHINVFSKKETEFCHALARINHIIKLEGVLETLVPAMQRYSPPIAILDFNNQSDSQILEGGASANSTQDDPDLDVSNHSTEDACNGSSSAVKKTKSVKKKVEAPFHARSLKRRHLRELDFHVLNLLEIPMGEDLFDADVNVNTDSQEHNQLFPNQLLYLLQDLKRKLLYKLQNDKKANPFATTPTHVGFEKLDKVSISTFGCKVCDLLPRLFDHLESISSPLQGDGIEDFEIENRRLIISCYELLVEVILSIISWKGLKSDVSLLKSMLYNVGKRISPDVSESSTVMHLLKTTFSYMKNFESTIAKASLTCATNFAKLLSALAELDQDVDFDAELNEFAISMLKTEYSVQSGISSSAGGKRNEMIGYLVKLSLQTSDDVMKSVGHFVDEALCKIGNQETKDLIYPCFQKSNIHVLYSGLLDVLADKISKIPGIKAKTDESVGIELLLKWNDCMKVVSVVMRLLRDFHSRPNIVASLKYGRNIIENFIKNGMPLCEKMFHLYQDDVISILKYLQLTTRQLQHLTCHSKVTKDVALAKQVPLLKKILETLLFRVKGMLALHNCQEAFWLGNLKNRNIQGEEILSQLTQQENSEEDSANMTCAYPDMSYSESY